MDLTREIELKTNILQEGFTVEEAALEEVGTKYTEKETWLFQWEFSGLKPGQLSPDSLRLPLGTLVQARIVDRSAYHVRKEGGQLILEKNGKFLIPIQWVERPEFYNKLTSDGIEMKKVGQLRGEDGLCFGWSAFCYFGLTDDQCRFCNFDFTHKGEADRAITHKKADQIGEVAAAVLEEGIEFHSVITGGGLPREKDLEFNIIILKSIIEHTGLEKVPGPTAHPLPPYDLKGIDRLHEAGAGRAIFNLEVWDPKLFKTICPGKDKFIGRDHWLKVLEYAVSVFGRGNVLSALLVGLEEEGSLSEGCEYLVQKGIMPLLVPWQPVIGSKMEGHPAPPGEWVLDMTERSVDLMMKYMPEQFTIENLVGLEGIVCGCYRCVTMALVQDVIRDRLGGKERLMTKDTLKKKAAV